MNSIYTHIKSPLILVIFIIFSVLISLLISCSSKQNSLDKVKDQKITEVDYNEIKKGGIGQQ